ncbi:hypothetical protein ACFWPH_28635 [Nocardia sp. NPDC058499]|uniref:hypothetical protein n=1 Tax=Nocardia sp. NPDC058499 TaxID=3346530 RepID=UPI003653E33E
MDSMMPDTTATYPATALKMLHSTAERVTVTAPADPAGAVRIIYEALALTATANSLIDQALMEFEFEVYWPGQDFLIGAREQYLTLAVDRITSVLPTPISALAHDHVTVLTGPEVAPRQYQPNQPDGYDGVVCDPDAPERARQLLLHRTQAVASANKRVWTQVHNLLVRLVDQASDPQHRTACRVTALLLDAIVNADPGTDPEEIHRRILTIEAVGETGSHP